MQSSSDKEYSGLDELLSLEEHMPNYNSYIMDLCSDLIVNKKRVVDFGAGIGTLSIIYREKYGHEPICIEIDKTNTKLLKKKGLRVFDDISNIPGSIDLVFSSNVLEHIKDDLGALKTIRNKLSDDAVLYLYLPAHIILKSRLDEVVGHYRRYNKKDISSKLKSSGFDIIKIHYADSLGFFVSLLVKIFGYNPSKGLGSPTSLRIYDKYILPMSKFIDRMGAKHFIGKNIVISAKVSR